MTNVGDVYFVGFFVVLIIAWIFRVRLRLGNGEGCVCFALLWPLWVFVVPLYFMVKIVGKAIDWLDEQYK